MPIPNTTVLITNCWAQAEGDLRAIIKEKYPDRDEEMITSLFHAELERVLEDVSRQGKVSEAFLADLQRHFPRVDRKHLSPISKGLVASVSFHSREVEAKTKWPCVYQNIRQQLGGAYSLPSCSHPSVRLTGWKEGTAKLPHPPWSVDWIQKIALQEGALGQ